MNNRSHSCASQWWRSAFANVLGFIRRRSIRIQCVCFRFTQICLLFFYSDSLFCCYFRFFLFCVALQCVFYRCSARLKLAHPKHLRRAIWRVLLEIVRLDAMNVYNWITTVYTHCAPRPIKISRMLYRTMWRHGSIACHRRVLCCVYGCQASIQTNVPRNSIARRCRLWNALSDDGFWMVSNR